MARHAYPTIGPAVKSSRPQNVNDLYNLGVAHCRQCAGLFAISFVAQKDVASIPNAACKGTSKIIPKKVLCQSVATLTFEKPHKSR